MNNAEVKLNHICNIDNITESVDISFLQEFSLCQTYYDYGDQLKRYVYGTFAEKIDEAAKVKSRIATANDIQVFEKRQDDVRANIRKCLGGIPASDTPLNPQITGTVECDTYRIEKVIFNARPNVYVTGNLYVPNNLSGKTGAVLFMCGHFEQAKTADEYQIVCQHLVHIGLVVFAIDPVGQGERFSYFNKETGKKDVDWGCPEHDYVGAQCMYLGDSTARYFVHDGMRAIDYLCTREEVDAARIGVTGNSGGGTQTSLMMLCDERIAAAAPGTFISDMKNIRDTSIVQDSEQLWNGIMKYGFDHDDILLCMTPKPVAILAVEYDFFPIEGTRKTVESAKRFWKMYGKEDHLVLFEDKWDHSYTPWLAQRCANFFSHHFLGTPQESVQFDRKFAALPSETLKATVSGQIRGEFPEANFIFEENAKRFAAIKEKMAERSDAQRKKDAKAWLHEKVYFNRKKCPFELKRFSNIKARGLMVEGLIWWSNEGVLNYGLLFKNETLTETDAERYARMPVTLAVWDNGTAALVEHYRWIRQTCATGRAVLVLDSSGIGNIVPNRMNSMPMHDFEGTLCCLSDYLIWQDDSLFALRVWDVLRAIAMLEQHVASGMADIDIYLEGRHGMCAACAAFLSDTKHDVRMERLPEDVALMVADRLYESHDVMNFIMPGMLQYFDYSDIIRWLK